MYCRFVFLSILLLVFSPAASRAAELLLESALLREDPTELAAAIRSQGDPAAGALLFHGRRLACGRCHAAGEKASPLGPDLAKANAKMTPRYIVESILSPSKVVEKSYQAVQVITYDGRVVTGILREDSPAGVKLLLPLESGETVSIPRREIEEVALSPISLMPAGQVNLLKSRQEFLNLARYVLEIAEKGADRARELRPDPALLEPIADAPIDHADQIAGLPKLDLEKGRELYTRHCVSCHGKDGNKTLNPLARRFSQDPLKFGTDPYAMWKTISYGNGLMFPQAALLSGEERYQVVHYIRESFIRGKNSSQYFEPAEDYLAQVNAVAEADAEKYSIAKIEVGAGMIDGSLGRQMNYGPYLSHSMDFSGAADQNPASTDHITERALMVLLPGERVLCYDAARGSLAGIWQGEIANPTKTHHRSYKGGSCMLPGGPVSYVNVDDAGWSTALDSASGEEYVFRGHFLHGSQVLLRHELAGVAVDELPGAVLDEPAVYSRSFRLSAAEKTLFCLIGRVSEGTAEIQGLTASLTGKNISLAAAVTGMTDNVEIVSGSGGGLWLKLPATKTERLLTLWFAVGEQSAAPDLQLPENIAEIDFDLLTAGGPRLWIKSVRTRGVVGEAVNGYAADEITLPFANPWGSWLRTTALDFFADGTLAVATLSGDVWLARLGDDSLSDISWIRYATGLYEPLGLKIVDDLVYVRGRDRITRLRDLNQDGQADHYESFHQEGVIGAGYHAFLFDLQTDSQGNFYFARSGRKSPHEGGVVKVSPDGKTSELVCRDFRHPNGMGSGGPHDWITVSDNPDGKAVFNGVAIVKPGKQYGYEQARTAPMLAVLPASADSSSGGQCWSDAGRWGPLSGTMIHTSYSRLSVFAIFTQNTSPYPNGFAVRLPFNFKSGVMRARVNPADGQVYVVGQKGWDTQAPYDGCLVRLRYVKESPIQLITQAAATRGGISLSFSCDLDLSTVSADRVEAVRAGDKQTWPVKLGKVSAVNARTILIELPEIEKETVSSRTKIDKKTGQSAIGVNYPLQITLNLKSNEGEAIQQTVYATINSLPKE